MKVNMHEAKSQLSRLARLAREGEEVVICKSGQPWVRLMPYQECVEPRQPGGLEGRIAIAPDFDETPREVIDSFYESKLFPGRENG